MTRQPGESPMSTGPSWVAAGRRRAGLRRAGAGAWPWVRRLSPLWRVGLGPQLRLRELRAGLLWRLLPEALRHHLRRHRLPQGLLLTPHASATQAIGPPRAARTLLGPGGDAGRVVR